jgi:hypothetical protein
LGVFARTKEKSEVWTLRQKWSKRKLRMGLGRLREVLNPERGIGPNEVFPTLFRGSPLGKEVKNGLREAEGGSKLFGE